LGKGFEIHREFYAHLRQSKDYDEGSAAFAARRKPEFEQEYYDGLSKSRACPKPLYECATSWKAGMPAFQVGSR